MSNRKLFPIAEGAIVLREIKTSYLRVADAPTVTLQTTPETIAEILRSEHQLDVALQESLIAFYFDSRGNLLSHELVYRGTVNSATVSTRDVARSALMQNAVGVVIAHNHPSGNPTPSLEDERFTQRLRQALDLFDVALLDHVILGGRSFLSMRERGML